MNDSLSPLPAPASRPFKPARPILLVFGLIWLTFYRLSGGFGYYEDDLHFFGVVTNYESFGELRDWWAYCWAKWPQGRPLGYSAMYGLGYLGLALGSLAGMQTIAFLLHALNTALLYRAVHRHISPNCALPVAIAFGLLAIATVRPVFTFAFYYDVSLFFFLVMVNLYATRLRWCSYLALAAAMLSQEPIAISALVVPWLFLPADRRGVKSWLLHVVLWILVVGAILAARAKIGDPWGAERVASLAAAPLDTAQRSLESVGRGTLTHIKLLGARPIQAFAHLTFPGLCVFLVAAVAVATAFGRESSSRPATPAVADRPKWRCWLERPEARLLLVGLACIVGPYAAYFRDYWYPCTAEHGFFSAVHVMPSFGSALVLGALARLALDHVRPRLVAAAVLGAYFGSLALFGDYLQRDYARNWGQQKEFWREVYRLCPDLEDGIDVLVLNEGLDHPRFMAQFTWADELTPGRLFRFPPEWKRPPRAYLVNPDVAGHHIRYADGQYTWILHPSILNHQRASSEVIAPGTIIMLRKAAVGYERLTGTYPVNGGELPLKEPGPGALATFGRRPFAELFGLPPPVTAR